VQVIIMILSLVGFPLVVVGGIAGRNLAQPFEAPCRTTKAPPPAPPARLPSRRARARAHVATYPHAMRARVSGWR
jgi:hypothetical protein